RHDRPALGHDAVGQARVLARVEPVERGTQYRDRPPVSGERAEMRGGVDSARQAGDDDEAGARQATRHRMSRGASERRGAGRAHARATASASRPRAARSLTVRGPTPGRSESVNRSSASISSPQSEHEKGARCKETRSRGVKDVNANGPPPCLPSDRTAKILLVL